MNSSVGFRIRASQIGLVVVLALTALSHSGTVAKAEGGQVNDSPCGGEVTDQVIRAIRTTGIVIQVMTFAPIAANLQPAINFAESGTGEGTVLIPRGSYTIAAPLSIQHGPLLISGNGPSDGTNTTNATIIKLASGSTTPAAFIGQGTKVRIMDLSIDVANNTGSGIMFSSLTEGEFVCLGVSAKTYGINIASSAQTWIHQSTFTVNSNLNSYAIKLVGNLNAVNGGNVFNGSIQSVDIDGDGNEVESNTVNGIHPSASAIDLNGESNSARNNTIHSNGYGGGVGLVGSGFIEGNTMDHLGGGAGVQGVTDVTISGNTISSCHTGISVGGTGGNWVDHNTITNCSTEGIFVDGGASNQIHFNTIEHPGNYGIKMLGSNANDVANNHITFAGFNGIRLFGSDNNDIISNWIEKSQLEGILTDLFSNGNQILSNNLVCNNAALDPLRKFSIHIEGPGNLIDFNDIHFQPTYTPAIFAPGSTIGAGNTETVCS